MNRGLCIVVGRTSFKAIFAKIRFKNTAYALRPLNKKKNLYQTKIFLILIFPTVFLKLALKKRAISTTLHLSINK